MSKPHVLVAGIGNIFLGDDGFGCEVARQLQGSSWPREVRLEDFGIRGFDLAFALLLGYERTILIDTVSRGGVPGTLYKIEPELDELDDLNSHAQTIETHGMDPMKVLAIVRSMGGNLHNIVIVGCEPAPLISPEGDLGLSPAVSAAIPEAVRMVESIVSESLSARVTIANNS